MKLKREEIAKIAGLILTDLKSKSLIILRVPEEKIRTRIEAVILKNLEEEVAIEEEVKRLMEQHRDQIASGSIDSQKAFMMIKKQVAKEKKFIL
jgi:hypothetical protein